MAGQTSSRGGTSIVKDEMFAGGVDWVALGSQIQDQSLKTMKFFTDLKNQEDAKRQRAREFAENKRRFGITTTQTNRAQNLSALDRITQQRTAKPMSYTDAISKAVRSY